MTRSTRGRLAAATASICAALFLFAGAAQAHNAGHFSLPDGTCHEIGSFKDAPLVGADRSQLDLVPETPTVPFDEYGASFVGFQGNTPIFPGGCPR